MEKEIKTAIKKAIEKYPKLEEFDNPYERIAEFLPHGGYETFFPEVEGENSFDWAEKVDKYVDELWIDIKQEEGGIEQQNE